jgi:hypothetical protein
MTLPITDDTLPIANPRCVGDSPGIFARPYIGIFRVRFSGISLGGWYRVDLRGSRDLLCFLQFWTLFWTLFWTPIFRVNFALFLAFLKLHFRGF